MNKKNTIKKTAAILLGLALSVGATGCNFVVTDNEKDLAQTVASVDITSTLTKSEKYKDYADDVSAILDNLTSDISKRDLVAYFLSTGYQYVESYGYTYADTFNMLLDGLISREIMIQYAVAHYFEQGVGTKEGCEQYIAEQLAALDVKDAKQKKEKELLEAHPEVLTLKYFLTEGGKEAEDYDRAVYSLKQSLNNSLDSMEANYITTEEEHEHGEARTLPTGAGEVKTDYYAKPGDYDVYTGRNTLDSCGEYKKVDGSTTATRQKAYNAFLANLEGYNLVQKSGSKVEDTRDVTLIDYYYVELGSALGQALISKYYEDLEETIAEDLTETYVTNKYNAMYEQQKSAYENDPDAFATALDEASADTFILYGLEDFGFVYNILVPFSTSQTEEYTRAQNNGLTQDQLYNVRKRILSDVRGTDQRGSWISMDDHVNYSYADGARRKFFKDNVQNTEKYTELTHYQGMIPYYGKVELVDGEFECTPTKLHIDTVVDELQTYVKLLGKDHGLTMSGAKQSAYAETNMSVKYVGADDEVMYNKFVYEIGQIDFAGDLNPSDYFVKDTAYYDFVSAVNEVTFAYSTDPGSLNSYMGYAISPYSTNFMKEFEYAAQEAVKAGVGSYYVVPTDYGWHIIVSTFVFEKDGAVYDGYNHAEAVGENMIEGSFSNRFYESLKSSAASNYTNEVQSNVLNEYDNDSSVKRYEKRYKDLLEMDSQS
ncbi:MAG: hypothetical protein IJX49_05400 [Clostridia bacterium]|nr:hypothetical protein [Clostridia bacterium]